MICWLLTTFFTSILLSCSVVCYLAICILRACLSVCLYLSWPPHFRQKLTESTNGNFQVCPRKKIRFWVSTFQLAISWADAEKTFSISSKKWVKKMKKKNNRCGKAFTLTPKRRNSKRFLKYLYFNKVYSIGALSQLILMVA